ncbi:acetate/propionate family kinase [Litorivivens sp.]|uniref:acetate/propionate family kinase n=1 Tax=Litorivivens sp. TaxID=2020868 RepID=UPI003564C8D7
MKILALNAGSSSLKFALFDMAVEDCRLVKAEFENFKDGHCVLHFRLGGENSDEQIRSEPLASIEEAIQCVPTLLQEWGYSQIDAIGHRVIHGGERFTKATLIDSEVLQYIQSCTPLAPLHNPANLAGITTSKKIWPSAPQIAVFDTAFHHSLPVAAYTYAIPSAWRKAGARRYGFHGISHQYVAMRTAQAWQSPIENLRIISCHLGNGSSLCAIENGTSVDTSMGMSPLTGLAMGTRSGDFDPGLFSYLSRQCGLDINTIEQQLYTDSGLKALGGSPDLRNLEQWAAQGNLDAQLAIEVYAYSARKYLGAFAAVLGGIDAVVFTGGIGENSATMRQRICDRLQVIGLEIDDARNRKVRLRAFEAPEIASSQSRVRIFVTKTCEQLMIAKEVLTAIEGSSALPHAVCQTRQGNLYE